MSGQPGTWVLAGLTHSRSGTGRRFCKKKGVNVRRILALVVVIALAAAAVSCVSSQPSVVPTTMPAVPSPTVSVGAGPTRVPGLPIAPKEAPLPAEGKASISGVLYSYTIPVVVPGTLFYLTRASGSDKRSISPIITGVHTEAGDISGMSGDEGQISLNDIPPGNYFLVVWAPYNWVPADVSPTNQSARLIELAAGQREPLGIVYLSWP
jgi:hypothetical protein